MNSEVKVVLELLPPKTKFFVRSMTGIQLFLVIFDLLGLTLIGAIVNVGFDIINNQQNSLVSRIGTFLESETLSQEKFVMISGVFVLILFTARTLFSLLLLKQFSYYLGRKAADFSHILIKKLFSAEPAYLARSKPQEMVYALTAGVDNLILGTIGNRIVLFSEGIFISIISISIFLYQPLVSIFTLFVFGGTFFLIQKITLSRAEKISEKFADLSVLYSKKLVESLRIYRELFLRSLELEAANRVKNGRDKASRIRAELMFIPNYSKYLFELSMVWGAAIIATSQLLISDSKRALTVLVVFLVATSRVLPSIIRFQSAHLSLRQSIGASKITIDLLTKLTLNDHQLDSIRQSASKPVTPNNFVPTVIVRNLSFEYPDANEVILKDISFEVKPGEFIAIVGESGAGKTTLIDILLGLNRDYSGEVQVSGTSPKIAVKTWPGKIAYVPQDARIMDSTLIENITLNETYSRKDMEEIWSILKRVELRELVSDSSSLNGVHFGEEGSKLSGGQRQRLSIARAMYTNPKLVVFDEATSALDSVTESKITRELFENRGGITIFVVAHRLSTIKNADRILFLERGELIGSGSFAELKRKLPQFREQIARGKLI